MSQKLVIPLLAAIAFGAGYGSRAWTERNGGLTPPPADYVPLSTTNVAQNPGAKAAASSPEKRAKLKSEIEKVRGEIEAYTKRLQEIDANFDRDFVAILNPEQRASHLARQQREAERAKQRQATDIGPLTDDQIASLERRPLWNALYKIACTWRLESDTKTYKLDGHQQQQLLALLQVRREKYIALIDASTPPSIRLSQLATQVQKLDLDIGRTDPQGTKPVDDTKK